MVSLPGSRWISGILSKRREYALNGMPSPSSGTMHIHIYTYRQISIPQSIHLIVCENSEETHVGTHIDCNLSLGSNVAPVGQQCNLLHQCAYPK